MREELHKLLPKELLQEEFDKGLWHKDIAEKYKVSWRQIYYLVEDYGLKIPRKNQKKEITKYKCSRCGKEFRVLYNGICNNCKNSLQHIENELFIDSNNSPIHEKILELREIGKSYSEIAKEVNCSRSTVSYHCNQDTKNDVRKRTRWQIEQESWKYKLLKAIGNFKKRKMGTGRNNHQEDWNKKLRTAVSHFRRRLQNMPTKNYTYKDVIKHFGGTIVNCALTGRKIDILKDSYCIDHIIPVAKGGTNELENMAIVIPEANAAKSDLTNEEFVALCKEVCEHFGYEVKKKE